jgi:hypothetical protein
MPEQSLLILKAYPSGRNRRPNLCLDTHFWKVDPNTGSLLGSGHHADDRLVLIHKDVRWTDPTECLHD